MAGEYKKIKEYDFALAEYRKVIELSSDYSWAYFNIAQIYFELNRVDDAIVMLQKTIEKNPNDIEAYKILAQIMINNNKQDDAMEMLNELSEKQENGDIYYLMSKIFELNDDELRQLDYYLNKTSDDFLMLSERYLEITLDIVNNGDTENVFDFYGIPVIGTNWYTF